MAGLNKGGGRWEAISRIKTVPEGKVIDFVTGRLLNDTPEEYVRQNIERSLVLEYRYARDQIAVEFPIKMGSKRKRVDLAVFEKDTPHEQQYIRTIVEVKKPGTKPEDKKEGIEQLRSYMTASLNCTHGMWTNGEHRSCFQKVTNGQNHQIIDAIDIPGVNRQSHAEAITRGDLRAATGDNLLFAFRRCHNYIAGNQGLQKNEAFWELLKLIFCKIEDERSDCEGLSFFTTLAERTTMNGQAKVKGRIALLFKEHVVRKYPTIFAANEELEMIPSVLAYVVSELQSYSLLGSSVDVKGVAYEEVVGSNLRGDRGEFFTPRNACRMAVRMLDPQPNEVVLDPACGTGGFLVTAMNHALGKLEETERHKWMIPTKPGRLELEELYRRRADYLGNCVFGLDLNPNLVRAAKMNMVMNNDGSGRLYQCNSLEHPHQWNQAVSEHLRLGSVDVLFTNPPFGTKITIDDPRILSQYQLGAQWEQTDHGGWGMKVNQNGEVILQSSQPPEVLFVERCLQFLKPGSGRMAIVLPNGLLNNAGLAYFRYWLMEHAQILAIVDMHRDLFQPKNDTQTSMVLLRRKAPGEILGDYPIFMAIADTVGHDKRGTTIYKRQPDGGLILQERFDFVSTQDLLENESGKILIKEPVVDDELGNIAAIYEQWISEITEHYRIGESG